MKKIFRTLCLLLILAVAFLAFAAYMRSDSGREYVYERSETKRVGFDQLTLSEPYSKNSADLVKFALYAWESGWGYVWGTFGDVLDESTLDDRAGRYPSALAPHMDFIRDNWLGYRAADCSGLIKAYFWYEPGIGINYGANGYPDIDSDTMFERAPESGEIDSIPEMPGLAVWCEGHIGIYIGDGVVVEAMGTEYGVVKTELSGYTGSRWTHWMKIEGISYP